MIIVGLYKMAWTEMFSNLVLFGKILFFIPLALLAVAMIPLVITEFVGVDIWVFLVCLLSKDVGVEDFIEFCFGD